MSAYQCPFCNVSLAVSHETYANYFLNFFDVTKFKNTASTWKKDNSGTIKVVFVKCPNCKKISIYAFGHSKDLAGLSVNISPRVNYMKYPDYVPETIQKEYQEACSVLEFSEKAAATFARRCLREIIHDCWDMERANLFEELYALQNSIDKDLWRAIEGVCNIGDIGNHMKADVGLILDVQPMEAQRLIKLVELLIKEWYIAKRNRDLLLEQLVDLDVKID